MTLSDEAEERLAGVARLQPTKNRESQNHWDLESGSEVHRYLEFELKDCYYHDDNGLIRATAKAAEFVGIRPGAEGDDEVGSVSSVTRVLSLGTRVSEVIAGPDERSKSVVSVLNKLRGEFDIDPDVNNMHRALQNLRRKDAIEVAYRTVPTFCLTVERNEVDVEVV